MTAIQRRISLEEFLSYDDGTEARYELVNGVLVEMGNEAKINTLIAGFLFSVFLELGIPAYRIGFKQKIEVHSEYATARDPDLIIHSEASAATGNDTTEFCLKLDEPNPLLVIEIASPGEPKTPNYDRDYVQKRNEYAARGISEYWIIDPDRSLVKIGTLVDRAYEFQDFTGDDRLISPSFPNLKRTARELLSAGR